MLWRRCYSLGEATGPFLYCWGGMLKVKTVPTLLPSESTPSYWCKRKMFVPQNTCTAAAAAESLQSCPALCDPIDGSPPGSPVPGILQVRTLE